MFLFNDDLAFSGAPHKRWVHRTKRPGPDDPDFVRAYGATGTMISLKPTKSRFSPGSVLVVGGTEDMKIAQRADVYDPALDAWCPATSAPLGIPRVQPASVMLPDGTVLLVSGGVYPPVPTPNMPQRTPQILDPETGAVFTGTPWPDPLARGYHNTALLLPDARVIVLSGRTYEGGDPDQTNLWDEQPTLRYYSPPYLTPVAAGAPRPEIVAGAQTMHYGQPYSVTYAHGAIVQVALLALGSQTHSFDMNQRRIELAFQGGTADSGDLVIQGPPSNQTAPEGYYMLFLSSAISGWKVPSVAKIVEVR
jgi:hypothetical protein